MDYILQALDGIRRSFLNFPSVGLNSIIDIIAVSYIFYTIIYWIRETRAWTLFKGIIVLVIIALVSALFQLHTLLWLLQFALINGILAAVIIFQPEVRKALEQLGKGTFSFRRIFDAEGKYSKGLSEESLLKVISACEKMAHAKTGALIVLEHDVKLGDYESTGIIIDAAISAQLLINIFENKTPLHDGAVLIRSNRVAAATCILPLTQSELSSELGTRHRAAVGASEVSDAHIIVVSEETGHISVALSGHLYRDLSRGELVEMIIGDMLPRKRRILWKGR